MKRHIVRRSVLGIATVVALLLSVTWAVSAITSTSPVGLWSFNEGAGTIAHDSADGLDATIHGAGWTTGRLGAALEFDGVDDGVEASGPVMGLTTAGSLEAWVKPKLIESGVQEIIINGDSSGITWNIRLYLEDSKPGFSVFSTGGIGRWTVGYTISPNEWHHVVGTFDGSTQTAKIYVDGLLAGSWGGAGTNLMSPCCRGLTIGTQPFFGSGWRSDTQFNGIIDEVAIYDTVLSPEEIWDDYVAGSSAGFVTGGGWIDSEPGAYIPDPLLEGRATFGFGAKYKKGAIIPTGNTQFQFHAGDLNFHSNSYDWLVVPGSGHAKFQGTGTINGAGEYKFQIWAGDDQPDTFRLRIWDEKAGSEVIVYDNGPNQAIGGGSIVVHTK